MLIIKDKAVCLLIMRAIITIFKAEFTGKEDIGMQLTILCDEVKEVGDAYVYSTRPGKLFEFLNIVKTHHIAYGTHVNSAINDSSNRADLS